MRIQFVAVLIGLLLSVGIIAWVGIDTARRRRNWLAWSGLSAFSLIVPVIWLIVRRRWQTAPEPLGFRRSLFIAAMAIPLVAIGIMVWTYVRTFVVTVARVEGHAMSPTLRDQDRVLVNRMVYQFRDPSIGEIVMMYYPLNPEKKFIKRVIGMEGDQIRLQTGHVFRNDVATVESFVPPEFRSQDTWGPQIVPEGFYFVMGDHRNNSSDSRHWGWVPKKYILGRVECRWWPPYESKVF